MSDVAVFDLEIQKGGTFRQDFTWQDDDGTPISLSGYSAVMQVRESVGAAATLLELTEANGGLTITAVAGKVSLYLSATATAALTWRRGVYDIRLTSGTGDKSYLVGGAIKVVPRVTQ